MDQDLLGEWASVWQIVAIFRPRRLPGRGRYLLTSLGAWASRWLGRGGSAMGQWSDGAAADGALGTGEGAHGHNEPLDTRPPGETNDEEPVT